MDAVSDIRTMPWEGGELTVAVVFSGGRVVSFTRCGRHAERRVSVRQLAANRHAIREAAEWLAASLRRGVHEEYIA